MRITRGHFSLSRLESYYPSDHMFRYVLDDHSLFLDASTESGYMYFGLEGTHGSGDSLTLPHTLMLHLLYTTCTLG